MIQHNSADRVGEIKVKKKDKSIDKEFESMHYAEGLIDDNQSGIKFEEVKYDG